MGEIGNRHRRARHPGWGGTFSMQWSSTPSRALLRAYEPQDATPLPTNTPVGHLCIAIYTPLFIAPLLSSTLSPTPPFLCAHHLAGHRQNRRVEQVSIEERLAALEQIEAIKALKHRYFRACDAKDPDTFRACFIADGADIDYGPLGGVRRRRPDGRDLPPHRPAHRRRQTRHPGHAPRACTPTSPSPAPARATGRWTLKIPSAQPDRAHRTTAHRRIRRRLRDRGRRSGRWPRSHFRQLWSIARPLERRRRSWRSEMSTRIALGHRRQPQRRQGHRAGAGLGRLDGLRHRPRRGRHRRPAGCDRRRGHRARRHGIAVQCDHRDDAQIAALFARIADEQDGRLDLLVNNVWAAPEGLRRIHREVLAAPAVATGTR